MRIPSYFCAFPAIQMKTKTSSSANHLVQTSLCETPTQSGNPGSVVRIPKTDNHMKKNSITITRLACVAGLVLTTLTNSRANVLTNPGFETDAVLNAAPVATVTGWTDLDNAFTASANNDPVRTGIGSLQLNSPGGGFSVPEARQTFAASPGQTWYFKGYMLTTNALPAGPTFGLLKIVWRDSGGNDLAPGIVDIGVPNFTNPGIESTPTLNNSSAINTWVLTEAKGVAPAGTVSVVLLPLLVDQFASTVFMDDLVATNSGGVPLTAAITSPVNFEQVLTNFTINATASVLPGAVTNVNFYLDNVLIGNDESSPYTSTVSGASFGSRALKVVAQGTNGSGAFISITSAVVNVTVTNVITVAVNPAKIWAGFMNWFETPANGGGYGGGGGWATADLRATFSGSTLTLSPNTIGDPDGYWYVTTNSPSVGNKIMDASMYVEPAGSLPGATVTFVGTCISNTLTSNGAFVGPVNPAGNGWTCVAFIKDFAPDFSSSVSVTTTLTNGQPFRISLATINDPARHVQYGFQTVGPCVWPTDPVLASYGNVQVGPPAPTIVSSTSGSNISLRFATLSPFAYTVQYRTNLAAGTWSTLTTTNGTGAEAVVTDSIGKPQRFYRVSVQ